MLRMDRRTWIKAVGMTGAWALASGASAAKPALGCQLYTLGIALKTDFDGTLAKLAALDIRHVETAGLHGRTGAEFRASLDRAGLHCTSAHVQATRNGSDIGLDGDLDALARDMHALGVTMIVLPAPPLSRKPQDLPDLQRIVAELNKDDWQRTAELLNDKAKALRSRDLALSYHNHAFDFAPIEGGNGFDLLLRETDPALVSFEMDAGWIAAGGGDPVALLKQHPRRFTQMHVKDVAPGAPNFSVPQPTVALGEGRIDWKVLVPLAQTAGITGFYIEQEPPFTEPPLDAVKRSATYLRGLGVAA
jgi:sugar phosphate isomerase/epimerase